MTVQEDAVNTDCRWGPVKSPCGNKLANPKIVLLCLSIASVVQGMVVNGFVNVGLTSIEKRFNLPSRDTGLIASVYDIATVICLLPVGYFGGQGSKPRWIGFGMLILACGAFVFSLPHFLTGVYRYDIQEEDQFCDTTLNGTDTCKDKDDSVSHYKYVLMLGQILHGVGAAPLFTLGLAYIDEHLTPESSALYLGVFFAVAVTGPAIGYLLGGYFLEIFTDFDKVDTQKIDITPESEAWAGAWWIGPLLCSGLALLIAVPILGFPQHLPGWQELDGKKNSEVYKGNEDIVPQHSGIKSLKDFPAIMKSLLTNPTFIFLSLAGAYDAFLVAGFSSFSPKYIETQFSVSASTAAIIVGACLVVCGAAGPLLAGVIIKRWKLSISGIMKFCIAVSLLTLLFGLCLLVKCDQADFAGITLDYDGKEMNRHPNKATLRDSCNADCNCAYNNFDPVCGENDVTYFNPCVAGCSEGIDDDKKDFYNCTCIGNTRGAKGGMCKEDCSLLYVFIPLYALLILLTLVTYMPLIPATLRSVPVSQRSLAMCLQDVIIRPLGSIPGPILFGAVIDKTCLFWLESSCSRDKSSACYYYDNTNLGYYLIALSLGIKTLTVCCYILALCLYKPPPEQQAPAEGENTRF